LLFDIFYDFSYFAFANPAKKFAGVNFVFQNS
jgi:hypothetical protein